MPLQHVSRGQAAPSVDWNTMVDLLNGVGAAGPWLQVFNVKGAGFNAVGDGIANDAAPIDTAVAAAVALGGGIVYFPPGTYLVAANKTYPVGVDFWFSTGAVLKVGNTFTITINSAITAPKQKIFTYVGSGVIVLGATAVTQFAIPQWWDAKGDGATDDSAAINAASASLATAKLSMAFPAGIYRLLANVTTSVNVPLLFLSGATMVIENAVTATFNGPFITFSPVFTLNGTGAVVFGSGSQLVTHFLGIKLVKADGTVRAQLYGGSAGNRGVDKKWDATLAAYRYAYIDNGQIVVDDTEPT